MKNVLIVDDSLFMRRILKKTLTDSGYTVIGEADNGLLAVERYKELSPDIVLLDITMSELNGIGALERIMQHDRNAKVIMVSAMGQEAYVREAISKGAKNFIVKPFKPELVIDAVAKLG